MMAVVVVLMFCVGMVGVVSMYLYKMKRLYVGQKFVWNGEAGNPWLKEDQLYTIVEIENGWVRTERSGLPSLQLGAFAFALWMSEVK